MDRKKQGISLRTKILLTGIISLCILIIGACAVIGYQVYQINVKQCDQTIAQQFALIEQTVLLFMQNNKNTVNMLAGHPAVQAADESLNSYVTAKQDLVIKNVTKGQTEQEMVTLFKHIHQSYSETAEVFFGSKWGGFASSWDDSISAGFDPRTRIWYKLAEAAGGNTIVTPAYMSTIGTPGICFSRQVVSPQGSVIGCVSIAVNLFY